jgi:hypothetical protein
MFDRVDDVNRTLSLLIEAISTILLRDWAHLSSGIYIVVDYVELLTPEKNK